MKNFLNSLGRYSLVKFFSFVGLLVFSNVLWSQSIEIPDPQFKKILLEASEDHIIAYDLEQNRTTIDANNDQEIQMEEALNISRLNLHRSQIKSLEGIEAFQNLQELSCHMNEIESMDISMLRELKILNCSSNRIKEFIAGTDHPNLYDLKISYNQLTDLNLTGAIKLNRVWANHNQLQEICLDSCEALRVLYVYDNKLQDLDLYYNTELVLLNAGKNMLKTMDFSHNLNLFEVNVKENQIQFLNFKNDKIQILKELTTYDNSDSLLICMDHHDSFQKIIEGNSIASFNLCETDIIPEIREEVLPTLEDWQAIPPSDKLIELYPNPSSDFVNFTESISEAYIYDFSGQYISRAINVSQLDCREMTAGVYLVVFFDENHKRWSHKIIIE